MWVFFDFLSIPQKDRSLQLKAIASLPYYASLCSRFIPLVRDPDDWVSLHGGADAPPVSGTLSRYLERGWCRLEAVAALCPKRFDGSGAWRPGPLNLRFRLHQSPEDAGVGRLIVAADLLDPREGDFHNEADRAAIEQVLRRIALEYLQYEESGATCWDTMIDVRAPALTLALAVSPTPTATPTPTLTPTLPLTRCASGRSGSRRWARRPWPRTPPSTATRATCCSAPRRRAQRPRRRRPHAPPSARLPLGRRALQLARSRITPCACERRAVAG